MLWIILSVFLLSIAIFGLAKRRLTDGDESFPIWPIGAVALFLWLALTAFCVTTTVDAGKTGVKYEWGTSGSIIGELDEGVKFKAPWQGVREINTRTQVAKYEKLVGFSKESQDVFFDVAVNYRPDPAHLSDLLTSVGPNFQDVLMDNRVANWVKAESVKYPIEQVAPNREAIRKNLQAALSSELGPRGILIESVQVTNIDFQPAFKDSILAKQKATQDAQRAEQIVAQKEAEAAQAVAVAQGEADARRIAADAEAYANSTIAASVTPTLVDYQRALLLGQLAQGGKLQMVPANSILNIPADTTP